MTTAFIPAAWSEGFPMRNLSLVVSAKTLEIGYLKLAEMFGFTGISADISIGIIGNLTCVEGERNETAFIPRSRIYMSQEHVRAPFYDLPSVQDSQNLHILEPI